MELFLVYMKKSRAVGDYTVKKVNERSPSPAVKPKTLPDLGILLCLPRSGAEDYRKSLKIPDVLQARTVVISDIPEFLAGDNDHLLTFLTVHLPAVQIKDPVHARLHCLLSL
jgi:hypothetical protein